VSLLKSRQTYGIVGSVLLSALVGGINVAQQPARRFGGAYSELDERRQHLVDDWVARFVKVTGQRIDARAFYDDILSLSSSSMMNAGTSASSISTSAGFHAVSSPSFARRCVRLRRRA
jgi:hypothetical protein